MEENFLVPGNSSKKKRSSICLRDWAEQKQRQVSMKMNTSKPSKSLVLLSHI